MAAAVNPRVVVATSALQHLPDHRLVLRAIVLLADALHRIVAQALPQRGVAIQRDNAPREIRRIIWLGRQQVAAVLPAQLATQQFSRYHWNTERRRLMHLVRRACREASGCDENTMSVIQPFRL